MKEIIGMVIDIWGEMLIGVNVMVLGIIIGVIINIDGKYLLKVLVGKLFKFLYVGYIV